MRVRLTLLALVLASSGCLVRQSKYDAALAKDKQLETDLSTANQKQADTAKQLADSQTQDQTLSGQIADLQAKYGSLDASAKNKEAELGKVKGEAAASQQELAELRKQRDLTEKRLAAYKALQDKFRALVDTGKLQVAFRNGQMTLKLPAGILFPSGSDQLSKEGKAALADVTTVLLQFKDRRFLVAGHTDNQPIKTAQFPNNWYLATARANSVVQFMIAQSFPPTGLAAAGYGEFDPVAKNDTEKDREQNRRIEIILVPNLEELPNLTGATH
jgi:chemotaxis protein MotB